MVQKKDKKLLKRIGATVCAFALAIVAFSFPFFGDLNSKNKIASADTVSQTFAFNGSSLVTLSSCFIHGAAYYFGFANFTINLNNYNGYVESHLDWSYYYVDVDRSGTYTFDNKFNDIDFSTGENITNQVVLDNGAVYFFYLNCHPDFNCDIKRVRIYSIDGGANNQYDATITTYVEYYDSNDNTFSVIVPCRYQLTDTEPLLFTYSDRFYYLATNFNDNDYFNNGYNEGYLDGKVDGEESGYNSGYKAGETIGYNNGYSAGANAAGEYTFFGLVSAVIDAPIQAFMSLFNFELLGINLAGFFTGLLTLAFIITIVRLIMP